MISNFNQKLARWAGLLGAVLVAVWLVAVPVLSAANAPRVSVEPIPAGLTAAEWAGIQSQITQTTYLKASNTGVNDEFGRFVAMNGDTLVVTAYMEDSNATGINGDQNNNLATNSGAAYVFVRQGDSWVQQAYLKASNTGAGDFFGRAVAISGDTIVIGAPWENSNATGVNGDGNNDLASEAGAAYVFVRDGETWSQQAYLKASNTGATDRFAVSVAISGDTIVIGAYQEDSNALGINGDQNNNSAADAGAAYVFVRAGTTWTQQAYLKASNTDAGDWFGNNVAVDGDTLLVVARREASNATGINGDQSNNSAFEAGAGYVFVRNGTEWSQQVYLKASNTQAGDRFGYGVAMDNDTLVIGTLSEDSNATGVNGDQNNNLATDSGAAYVFHRTGAIWSQQAYLKASNTGSSDEFGLSADISGDLILIGTYGEDSNATGINGDQNNNTASGSGAAYLFERTDATWSQIAYIKASNAAAGDEFGRAVLSGNTLIAGSRFEDSNAIGVNGDQNNNLSSNSGSAYVFEITRPITGLIALNDSPTIWGNLTHLTATVSGGNNITYTWDLGDGTLVNGDVVSHTYPAIGVYTATVTATNSVNQLTATTIVTITDVPADGLLVVNDSPTLLGDTTNFTATVSGGTNVSYTWDLGDGNTAVGSTPSHTYPAIGVYTATLTATNPINQLTATTIVTITDVPVDGLIVVNDSPTTLGDTTNFTATVSGGTNVTYTWDLGDGNTAVGSTPAHTYPAIGTYTATVTATNPINQLTATTIVTITDVPVDGLVVVNNSPTALGETTSFTATVSGGTNVTYTWDLGDGNTAVGSTPTHIYPAVGTYTATVTATNGVNQLTGTTTVTITAVPPTGNSRIYLPLIVRPFAFQLGQASPVQPVVTQGAVYYVNTVQIPADLPTGGQYYLSASGSTLVPVVVDDRLILSVGGSPIFTYDFGQPPTGSTIALTADIVAQMAGQTVSVVYQDVYGHQQGATAVWLIWVP